MERKDEGGIDAGGAEDDLAPRGLGNLVAEEMKVKVEPLAAPEEKRHKRRQYHQSQDQLPFIQAFSDSSVAFIVWSRASSAASPTDAEMLQLDRKRFICRRKFAGWAQERLRVVPGLREPARGE